MNAKTTKTDDDDEPETHQLVAMERGFIGRRMVNRGEPFSYTGDPTEVPWAKPAKDKLEVPKDKPLGGDTKPKEAQDAVKKKAASATGADLA